MRWSEVKLLIFNLGGGWVFLSGWLVPQGRDAGEEHEDADEEHEDDEEEEDDDWQMIMNTIHLCWTPPFSCKANKRFP